jgi:hypothetical protein
MHLIFSKSAFFSFFDAVQVACFISIVLVLHFGGQGRDAGPTGCATSLAV